MTSWCLRIRVEHVDYKDEYTEYRAFSGTVEDVAKDNGKATVEAWKGKHVIGVTANTSISTNDVIANHPVSRVLVLPQESKITIQDLVGNIIPLSRALVCENLYLQTVENEIVVLVAGSMTSAVPYLQWMLIKNIKVILYLPPAESDADQEKVIDGDYKHALFGHGRFKLMVSNVIIRRQNIENLSDDVLSLTHGIGASAIAVLPDASKAFKTEEVRISRQVLLAAGMGCRIVWHQPLEQVDPCEAKCLYSKGISLGFFNFDATLEAHCADGIVQHALLETVKGATHNTVYTERYNS
ncbi:ppiC-type peptidyl-prolyl cis-trans isomerase, putative [Babesia ovis]|uniref:PpiC-type peptidyl-prolyl cis-trans isomerase, putative n=1 Tax=Babesia ovis TaxID=5869 RepID=A0A9W5TDQ1_BABOV|nr:ppiC-type peptidyl-prolyl cis-trans isomerase, putative [Babesia ovis]